MKKALSILAAASFGILAMAEPDDLATEAYAHFEATNEVHKAVTPLDAKIDGVSVTNRNFTVEKMDEAKAYAHSQATNALAEANAYTDQTALALAGQVPTTVSNIVTKAYVENLGITLSETDPTVPAWAKASAKPTYTASEVGALSSAGGTLLGDLTVESAGEKSEISVEHGNEYIALRVKDNKATIETSDYTYAMPHGDGTIALTKNIPNVPAWALAAQKPTYTASEVGATSPTAVSNIVTTAYVREKLGVYLYVGEDGGIYVHTNEE